MDAERTDGGPTAFAAGRYLVRRVLGAGGQKTVYLARDTALQRDCAIAWLTALVDPDAAQRLRNEARALARMGSHPHIVTVYDMGEEADRPFVVSEFVSGGDLAAEIARAGTGLPIDRALSIAGDVLRGLSAVHEQGIIHRDLKPSNVWIDSAARAKLGDFGLALSSDGARLTITGAVTGTPAYVSPEQLRGEGVDGRTDLYSFGCLVYEVLTGRLPFIGPLVSILSQHLHATPAPPSHYEPELPPAVDRWVQRLLAKHPSERPESARAALDEIETIRSRSGKAFVERETVLAISEAELAAASAPRGSDRAGPRSIPDSASGVSAAGGRPLTGRAREVGALVAALDEAAAGRGHLFLLTGEAGIGKSRLAAHMGLEAVRRGFAVAWGRCWEAGGAPQFWPWVEALRALMDPIPVDRLRAYLGPGAPDLVTLVPELEARLGIGRAPSVGLAGDRFRLFDAVSTLLIRASAAQPALLLFEDLHAADTPTLLLMAFVAQRLHGSRLAVVASYRDVEALIDPDIADHLAKIARHGRTLALKRLDRDDVAKIIRASGVDSLGDALVERVFTATEGNPLFVDEVLRLVEGGTAGALPNEAIPIPDGIRGVIRENFARLDPTTRATLEMAAAIGRSFALPVLSRASAVSPDEIRRRMKKALRRGLIGELAPGRYTFSHVLIRDVLHDELSDEAREAAHLAVADALEAMAGDGQAPLAEIAHHLALAGTAGADRAIAASITASHRAIAQLAPEEAVTLLERALETLDLTVPGDWRRRCEILIELGAACILAGQLPRGEAACLHAAELARRHDTPDLLARAALSYGARFLAHRVDRTMIDLLREALTRLGDTGSPALRARLLSRLAAAYTPGGDRRERNAIGRRAVELARTSGDRATLLAVLDATGWGFFDAAQPEERCDLERGTIALANESGERSLGVNARMRFAMALLELSDLTTSDAIFREIEVMARELRGHPGEWWLLMHRALCANLTGSFADANLVIQQLRTLIHHSTDPSGPAFLIFQAYFAALVSDDRAGVVAATLPLIDLCAGVLPDFALLIRALTAARAGDPEVARDALARRGIEPPLSMTELWLGAEAAWIIGDRAWAKLAYPQAVARTDRLVIGDLSFTVIGPEARSAMLLALNLDRRDEAEEHFQTCVRICTRVGARPALAILRRDYASALAMRCESDAARGKELRKAALLDATALGMSDLAASLEPLVAR